MFKKPFIPVLIILILIAGIFSCKKNNSQIVIKGSSTILPLVMKFSEEYSKINNVSFSVTGTGSSNGTQALIQGTCDIADSSRAMSPEEYNEAISRGIDLQETAIAYDMVVPIVHPSNPVNSLAMGQLQEIYKGAVKNWNEVGGKNEPIVVVSRDSSSGTYHIWYKKVIVMEEITPKALLQATNGTMVYTVAENPKSIGYISYGYINSSVKPLKVNNVNPSIGNGKNGTYPISRKLYMYTNKKNLKEETIRFIDFVVSDRGQQLVKEAGYIPL